VAGQALRGPVTLGITADAVVLERIHRRIARTGSEKGPKPAPPSEREGSARNAWRVRVDRVEESKERPSVQLVLCSLTGGLPLVAAVTLGAARTLRIRPRAHLLARVKATAIRVEGRFAPSH
jgi:molybdopterin-binding protein